MKTYLTEFDIQDFDWITLAPDSWAKRSDRAMVEGYSKLGPAITLWTEDGTVIACAGVACGAWKGFGEYWLVPSVHVKHFPKAVFKTAVEFIEDTIDKLGLYRVQAVIMANNPAHVRWIEALGFEREGLMKKFGPMKEDKFLYARVN